MPAQLPRSIAWTDEAQRAAVLAATKDGAPVVLVHHARDTAQPWPHAGIILLGRRLAGWLTRSHQTNNGPRSALPPNVYSVTLYGIVPAPGSILDSALMHFGERPVPWTAHVVHNTEDAFISRAEQWDSPVRALVKAAGAVLEVVEGHPWSVEQVLPIERPPIGGATLTRRLVA